MPSIGEQKHTKTPSFLELPASHSQRALNSEMLFLNYLSAAPSAPAQTLSLALFLCFLCSWPILLTYTSHYKTIFMLVKVYTKRHSSILMAIKPIGYLLDSQGCGKDSAASLETLLNLYDTTTRVLNNYSVPKYR